MGAEEEAKKLSQAKDGRKPRPGTAPVVGSKGLNPREKFFPPPSITEDQTKGCRWQFKNKQRRWNIF